MEEHINIKENSIENIISKLKEYDIISFDIFDTLIFRPFINPKDLFRLLSKEHNCLNFYQERIKAERNVRNEKRKRFGHHEVTLEEIYIELHKNIGIDVKLGCQKEFEKEYELCYANPFMKKIFEELQKNNKKIIIVSDMYLGCDKCEKILKKCGYKSYEKIYVSSDYNLNKRSGELFDLVREDFKNKKIIHIGDKIDVDYQSPMKHGIDGMHYKAPNSLKHKSNRMSATINSLYDGIRYNNFYNGLIDVEKQNVDYRYGYEYSGIFVLGYVSWIHKYALNNKIDKILFLSRDGYILKKVYDKIYDDIPSEYVLWSRYASLKTAPSKDFSRFLWQLINRKISKNPNILVKDLLKEMGLEFLQPKLNKVGIYEDSCLRNKKIKEIFNLFLIDNYDCICEDSKKYFNNAKKYYKSVIGNYKKIAIVDIGYRASGAISLINLFKDWGFSCDAKALIAFGIIKRNSFDDTLMLNDEVVSYVFSDGLNKDLYFDNNQIMIDMSIIEILLTAAPAPSFLYFSNDSDGNPIPVFEDVDKTNYERIKNLHKGIIDFSSDYLKRIKTNKYLLNIPGYDAYLPIYQILNDERKFKKFYEDFKEYKYSYMVSSNKNDKCNFGKIYEENRIKNSVFRKIKRKLKKVLR